MAADDDANPGPGKAHYSALDRLTADAGANTEGPLANLSVAERGDFEVVAAVIPDLRPMVAPRAPPHSALSDGSRRPSGSVYPSSRGWTAP